jgi:hypothetical protein
VWGWSLNLTGGESRDAGRGVDGEVLERRLEGLKEFAPLFSRVVRERLG